jgi:diadenylate cyclase
LLELLPRLAPGTPLREGIELVIQQDTGGLIVLGWNSSVRDLCSGGFILKDVEYTPERLAELAKMDGAIVFDPDSNLILRANVHLNPDPHLATSETGTRHRTAERTAAQTGLSVIAVSEGRRLATVYHGKFKDELESPVGLLPRANEGIHTMERFRRRLDQEEEALQRHEVNDTVTYRLVVSIAQRAEQLRRLFADVNRMAVALGGEGHLIELQANDAIAGVEELGNLVLTDYGRARGGRLPTLDNLSPLTTEELYNAETAARALRFADLDAAARARGWRLLAQVPRLPDTVKRDLIARFKSLPRLLNATAEELSRTEGIGKARARQIQGFFGDLHRSMAVYADHED